MKNQIMLTTEYAHHNERMESFDETTKKCLSFRRRDELTWRWDNGDKAVVVIMKKYWTILCISNGGCVSANFKECEWHIIWMWRQIQCQHGLCSTGWCQKACMFSFNSLASPLMSFLCCGGAYMVSSTNFVVTTLPFIICFCFRVMIRYALCRNYVGLGIWRHISSCVKINFQENRRWPSFESG